MKRPTALLEYSVLRWRADFGRELNFVSLYAKERAELGFADAHRVLQHGLEHRLQIARGRTDDAQHLGCRCLLLQRFTQLVKQSRILNGDDSLGGEVCQQLDLLVGERTNLLAEDV